jgi:hypothetical protein
MFDFYWSEAEELTSPAKLKNSVNVVFLICTVKLFINSFDLTVINDFVHQNLYLDFSTLRV